MREGLRSQSGDSRCVMGQLDKKRSALDGTKRLQVCNDHEKQVQFLKNGNRASDERSQ